MLGSIKVLLCRLEWQCNNLPKWQTGQQNNLKLRPKLTLRTLGNTNRKVKHVGFKNEGVKPRTPYWKGDEWINNRLTDERQVCNRLEQGFTLILLQNRKLKVWYNLNYHWDYRRPNQTTGGRHLCYLQKTLQCKYWNYNNQINLKTRMTTCFKDIFLFCSLFNTCLMHSRELLQQDLQVKQSVTVISRWSDLSTQDQRVSGNTTVKIKEISTFRHFKGFEAVISQFSDFIQIVKVALTDVQCL